MSLNEKKETIAIFTGAGISAESGLATFRDKNGLWRKYNIDEVATPDAFINDPKRVLDFYNKRRDEVCKAQPNLAHKAVASLESIFNVFVVTQNVDDLHERAGSQKVIHVHGNILESCSSLDKSEAFTDRSSLKLGDTCSRGWQLRPNVVWFGEPVENYHQALKIIRSADKILIIGTSLEVYPAAQLIIGGRQDAEKIIAQPDLDIAPEEDELKFTLQNYLWLQFKATRIVPFIIECWLKGIRVSSRIDEHGIRTFK